MKVLIVLVTVCIVAAIANPVENKSEVVKLEDVTNVELDPADIGIEPVNGELIRDKRGHGGFRGGYGGMSMNFI